MGQDSSNPKITNWANNPRSWHWDDMCSYGFNILGAFEVVLINLDIIGEDEVANITDTERFDGKYRTSYGKREEHF